MSLCTIAAVAMITFITVAEGLSLILLGQIFYITCMVHFYVYVFTCVIRTYRVIQKSRKMFELL